MEPIEKHTHLWNDLPQAERKRLMPYMIEIQIRHITQCKIKAITAHRAHLKALDDQIKNMRRSLSVLEKELQEN